MYQTFSDFYKNLSQTNVEFGRKCVQDLLQDMSKGSCISAPKYCETDSLYIHAICCAVAQNVDRDRLRILRLPSEMSHLRRCFTQRKSFRCSNAIDEICQKGQYSSIRFQGKAPKLV